MIRFLFVSRNDENVNKKNWNMLKKWPTMKMIFKIHPFDGIVEEAKEEEKQQQPRNTLLFLCFLSFLFILIKSSSPH